MEDNIEEAINTLKSKINDDIDANDALKFTQAMLNLAHTLATINHAKSIKND